MIKVARGLWARTRGLIGADGGFALLIPRCNWIHTCFMRYPLDVCYLDAGGAVVRSVRLAPGKFTWPVRGAAHVLEIPDRLDREAVLRELGDLAAGEDWLRR